MKKQTVEMDFLGHSFSYTTLVNEDGHALWNSEVDSQFAKWVHELKAKNRELFKIQYQVSEYALTVLDRLKDRFGVYDESLIVRALTIIFINFVDTRKGQHILKKLSLEGESKDLTALNTDVSIKKNLYFSPTGMQDIVAYSEFTGRTKSHAVKNALYLMLLVFLSENPDIKDFWEKQIVEQLTMILKAA